MALLTPAITPADDVRPAGPPPRKHRPVARTRNKVLLHVALMLGAVTMIIPFVWMIFTSVKSPAELAQYPPTFFPQEWHWSNYADALDAAPFGLYFRNSFIIATGHTLITLVVGSMAGYALARIRFRGREIVFLTLVAMLMIPTYTKIVPQFLIVKFMPLFGGNDILGQGGTGWLNTWWALIIPGGLSATSIFLFRQFYLSLPKELEEAARLDGLGEFRIFLQIYTPLIKPAIATVGLLTFQESWNNFLWPLLVTTTENLRVIQVGLAVFQQLDNTSWHYLMAGTTLATVPMVVLFVAAQKYFIQGFTSSGIK
ncbi:carbohydrate ABC transporter membrane protein 2 (CUT1 family) [Sediminihabitans luteus]|uniref:Carbohydrate ABC transporter membrane protein 2 (CUT1 family) n=1 Tax=Sediminihabitans luteus TaxID=1138585 RepID=A0A2M9D1A0_9CELL|nr:carbohydrate ABC transporter permease [Sediminihabitans luteus]PJJ77959.1 carbohydrate ABC transporter membrane protein 2 (CUT1 family) [Sediminihabitans luteus]GIJ00588.1 bicyclomycin resistance protein [Sediminihabitans luteus]